MDQLIGAPLTTGCRPWLGTYDYAGYGRYKQPFIFAHRAVYINAHGAIPSGLEIDHTCGNRWCVEVSHLEAVTHAENTRRAAERRAKTRRFCKHGHPWTGPRCKACANLRVYAWKAKHPDRYKEHWRKYESKRSVIRKEMRKKARCATIPNGTEG